MQTLKRQSRGDGKVKEKEDLGRDTEVLDTLQPQRGHSASKTPGGLKRR